MVNINQASEELTRIATAGVRTADAVATVQYPGWLRSSSGKADSTCGG